MNWAALFDVDGTMVDNRHHHAAAWLELGRRRGLPITPDYYQAHLHSRTNAVIGRLLLGPTAAAADLAALADEKETIYRENYRPVLREIPGLTAFLDELARSDIPCAAVSNSPPGNVDMVLDVLRIRRRFRCVLDCTQVSHGKPHPELLHTVAARLGIPAGRCLVFEDSVSGFGAAEAAGAPYVVVTAGAEPDDLPKAKCPVAMVKNFTGLTVDACAAWIGAATRWTTSLPCHGAAAP